MINDNWYERNKENSARNQDHRSPYQKDRARILHSAAFRRLQAKTQIIAIDENDFYRTRLTHSLEVAQIGSGLAGQLRVKYQQQPHLLKLLPDDALIETICLAHDLGHPPFGHGGETMLNYLMRKEGGFEGNAQTFRILTKLEPYTDDYGMNLTRRTLLGTIKYPALQSALYASSPLKNEQFIRASDWKPTKGLYDSDSSSLAWVIKPLSEKDQVHFQKIIEEKIKKKTCFKSLDASIMELADDIAYGVHDFEDAIESKKIHRDEWESFIEQQELSTVIRDKIKQLTDNLFSSEQPKCKGAIGELVHDLVTSVCLNVQDEQFLESFLYWQAELSEEQQQLLNSLKDFVYEYVILAPIVQQHEFKGQHIIQQLFTAFSADPERLLPKNTKERWRKAADDQKIRVICDYISGMTDKYALKIYHGLYT